MSSLPTVAIDMHDDVDAAFISDLYAYDATQARKECAAEANRTVGTMDFADTLVEFTD